MRILKVIGSSVVLGALVSGAVYGGMGFLPPPSPAWQSVRISGQPVASREAAKDKIAELAKEWSTVKIRLRPSGEASKDASDKAKAGASSNPEQKETARELTLAELGVVLDEAEMLRRAEVVATQHGSRLGRISERLTKAAPLVNIAPIVRTSSSQQILLELKEQWDDVPQSARMDLEDHRVIQERAGRALDIPAAQDQLESFLAQELPHGAKDQTLTFTIPSSPIPAKVTSESIKAVNIETVLASFETHFSRAGDQTRRGDNIDNASKKLNGLVIGPNETVSFNRVVGERSEANGFKRAWEIFKGEMIEGIGGGTCQVASTFHAASLMGGLDVLERSPHSRPSAYIPMGLDSTVVFPTVDLKLKNPHPFPVVIHAVTKGNVLLVEVLGKEKPVKVTFGRDVLGTIPFSRKVVEESSLSGRRVLHKQHGIRGYRVRRTRELQYADGTRKVETSTDYYPPTTDIFHVPVGFDPSLLPTLPSEAGDKAEKSEEAAQASNSSEGNQEKPEIEIVNGRGVHAPSMIQVAPSRSVRLGQ
jgi:vancomycin resistance protein YoaR